MTTAIILAVLAAAALAGSFLLRRHSSPEQVQAHLPSFQDAVVADQSALGRMLLSAAKPLSGTKTVILDEESATYRELRNKLASAGGLYGGSVVVFVATQIAAVLIGLGILGGALLLGAHGMKLILAMVLSLALSAYPYQKIRDTSSERSELIDSSLPDFAELLVMPMSSGYGILPALDFTARRSSGPVADEVLNMLAVIQARARSEEQAFTEAGARLGTPASVAFFSTLSQAYTEGTTAAASISGQAAQLRKLNYERTRGRIKKLPNTLVVVMGLHLMPGLFVVILLPLLYSMGQATG